jgi:hypothetical protein
LRAHDELLCLVHGTVYEPSRAWDPPEPCLSTKGRAGTVGPEPRPWTQMDRLLWDTWREGDPIDTECPVCGDSFYSIVGAEQHRRKIHG